AVIADPSAAAAAARLVVGPAAAALAALIAELISEASAAAAVNSWGCVVKYAIGPSFTTRAFSCADNAVKPMNRRPHHRAARIDLPKSLCLAFLGFPRSVRPEAQTPSPAAPFKQPREPRRRYGNAARSGRRRNTRTARSAGRHGH